MDLETFNTASVSAAAAVLRPCADLPEWIEAIVAGRPYRSLSDLLDRADRESKSWRIEDVDRALAQHPRIGERARGKSAEARLSHGEQPEIGAGVADALAAANAEYEARFGRVFLIRAAGRTAPEILAALTERLTNPPADEATIVIAQLREIALLRLSGALS